MPVIIRYWGQYRRALITDELVKWGEEFVEVEIEGFKIPKHVHRNVIVQYDWTRKVEAA